MARADTKLNLTVSLNWYGALVDALNMARAYLIVAETAATNAQPHTPPYAGDIRYLVTELNRIQDLAAPPASAADSYSSAVDARQENHEL